jgi:acyl carrier protein
MQQHIRQFILSNFLFSNDESQLKNDDSLLERGIMDSTGVLELVAFLEGQFGIKVADDELIPENLDSVTRIGAFVTRKQAPVQNPATAAV